MNFLFNGYIHDTFGNKEQLLCVFSGPLFCSSATQTQAAAARLQNLTVTKTPFKMKSRPLRRHFVLQSKDDCFFNLRF